MDRKRPKPEGMLTADDKVYESPQNSPIIISLRDQFMSSPFTTESQAARDRKSAAMPPPPQPQPQNPSVARVVRSTTERPTSSVSGMDKTLPPVPAETTAGDARDRVGMLNAQLTALGNRRININRSIKQMTELMPTDNLLNSAQVVRKREMEKQKVETLRQELSEVQRQEYELGLKLHRAYKRLDKNAEWEPTTLWVRRVTG
jgi:hypothetical protein